MTIKDNIGRVPYDSTDTTRNWVETVPGARVNGKLKPNIVIRYATDTNFIHNSRTKLYADFSRKDANTRSVMNLGLPGQRILNILNWQVNETVDQPVQTASFECLNVLLKGKTTGNLAGTLSAKRHSTSINASYVENSFGTLTKVSGDKNVEKVKDPFAAFKLMEEKVQYRQFDDQSFTINNVVGTWPNPAIPRDDDNDVPDDASLPDSTTGIGAYYVLIDDEIVKVYKKSGNTFYIRPGGRGIGGTTIKAHAAGAKVTLLNYNVDPNAEWVGMGYLNLDDFAPQKGLLRPGTCFVSYEGYGAFPNRLYHDRKDPNRGLDAQNYEFTGYWFVNGLEPSIQEDGVPRIRVDLKSAGNMLDQQKITQDLVQRIKSKQGAWHIRNGGRIETSGHALFGSAGHSRNIPGDWVDYNSWDPSLKDSYPLKIKTEIAQHKQFFEHMRDTTLGRDCELCQQERKNFIKDYPVAAKDDLKLVRAVGKHIYKESIRVMQTPDGPIRTYIRLMGTLAASAWEHPALNTDLAQRFTKIPSKLYDNIRNVSTALCFNGNVDFTLGNSTRDKTFDWGPTYDDTKILGNVSKILCPFESTYDKAPFWQPMQDLADANALTFWINREGYPVMMPRGRSLRPNGFGYKDLDRTTKYKNQLDDLSGVKSWFMTHGSSISAYSHSINIDAVLTQVWVTASTAFDSSFTTPAAGTGFTNDGKKLLYSALGGNREGLSLTSGVQQVDTITLDNQLLGLDWDTQAANWGVQQKTGDDIKVLNPLPPLYHGEPTLNQGKKGQAVERVQKTINFFLIRRYITPVQDPKDSKKTWWTVEEDGVYGPVTKEAVKELQGFLNGADFKRSALPSSAGNNLTVDGLYGRKTYLWLKTYLDQASDYIKTDIWWYVQNGRDWNEYVAALTGVPVPLIASKGAGATNSRTSKHSVDTPKWVVDDKGMQRAVGEWQKNFIRHVRNVGNKVVDDSINKATVRSISTIIADPRVQVGDVIWCTIPGFLGMGGPPYKNGIYVTSLSRQMDTNSRTYSATYSGYRYRSGFSDPPGLRDTNEGFGFANYG